MPFEGSDMYDDACVGHFLWVEEDDALYLLANKLDSDNIFEKTIENKRAAMFALAFPFFSLSHFRCGMPAPVRWHVQFQNGVHRLTTAANMPLTTSIDDSET